MKEEIIELVNRIESNEDLILIYAFLLEFVDNE